ncbi:unnamed protein product, partial [Clonostachys byssicola]
ATQDIHVGVSLSISIMSDTSVVAAPPKAPPPLARYARSTTHQGLNFCSGIAAISDVQSSDNHATAFVKRSRYVLDSLRSVLEEVGSGLDRVLKVNVYLTSMEDYADFNEVWDEYFTQDQKPARTCVVVHQLPRGADVEIEATAFTA